LEAHPDAAAADFRQRIEAELAHGESTEKLRQLADEAAAWLAEQQAREDALAQRAAILHALERIGYEVREGMASAWVQNGRIVVHKPGDSAYGVEFGAAAAGTAVQTRVVTTAPQAQDRQRDKEVEETWCAEFARLRELLAEAGYQTELAQAHAPGAVPIKAIAAAPASVDRSIGRTQPNRRTID
jgi:hypothetical protein